MKAFPFWFGFGYGDFDLVKKSSDFIVARNCFRDTREERTGPIARLDSSLPVNFPFPCLTDY